jgi:phage recombination protein Bet
MNEPAKQLAVATKPPSLLARMAGRYGVDSEKMLATLKSTAFKGQVSNEQMMALLIVAEQHNLNPWTKEIYAFPDKQNGIVPVVGVDGWSRIINEHTQFDGMTFSETDDSCTCTIYRKDRKHPTSVTEYLAECKRNTSPWGSHPKRMLRHKAMIQCARLAFGFAGIYDQDEAERIIDVTPERTAAPDADLNEQLGIEDAVVEPAQEHAQTQPADTTDEPVTIEAIYARIDGAKTTQECQQAGLMVDQHLQGEDRENAKERYYEKLKKLTAKPKGKAAPEQQDLA